MRRYCQRVMIPQLNPNFGLKYTGMENNSKSSVKYEVWVVDEWRHLDTWIMKNGLIGANSESRKIIGFDLEWKPSFVKNERNRTALMQLATENCAILVQMKNLLTVSPALAQLIQSPNVIKVGVGIVEDLKRFQEDFNLDYSGYLDIGSSAKRTGLQKVGLASLVQHYYGVELPKAPSVRMSNWEKVPLSYKQIQYAAYDAILSRKLYDILYDDQHAEDFDSLFGDFFAHETGKSSILPGRLKFRSKYNQLAESDIKVKKFVRWLHVKDKEWFESTCKSTNGDCWRTAFNVYCSRLGWTFAFNAAGTRPKEGIVVDIIIDGIIVLQKNGSSKAMAAELGCQQLLEELLAIQRLVNPMELLALFAGRGPMHCLFEEYLNDRERLLKSLQHESFSKI